MKFGAHVSTSGGIETAVDRAAELGCESLQIFTQSPRTWKPTAHRPEQLAAFRAAVDEGRCGPVICHAIYFINLASPDPELYAKSCAALVNTCEVATAIGAHSVNFHVGSHKGAGLDGAMAGITAGLERALEALGPGQLLLLENSAGAGGTIGRDVAELARIVQTVDDQRVGICIDTCHIFVSGVDIRDPAVVEALLEEIDGSIGLERLAALHVNDSLTPLGSNRDRHANIGVGEIGEGLGVLLSEPRLQGLPATLETPGAEGNGPDLHELAEVRRIHSEGVARRAASR